MGIALLSLFPVASDREIREAKALMERYRAAKEKVETFPHRATDGHRELIKNIERAVALIQDDEVKRIIEFRYVKGNRHKVTRSYFSGSGMSSSTIDRKIMEGLTSIANTLIFCGQLDEHGK